MSLASLDIGVYEGGAQTLLQDGQVTVIDALKSKLKDTSNVFAMLDNAWIGEDRDVYKANVTKTIDNCCNALDAVNKEFAREIEEINRTMSEFRRTHVEDETY